MGRPMAESSGEPSDVDGSSARRTIHGLIRAPSGRPARQSSPPPIACPDCMRQPPLESMRDSLRRELDVHPVFDRLADPRALRVFMESHVACVWDYMARLASLRRDLASTGASVGAWAPPADADAARLIDELVLASQSDEVEPGRFASHLEWYFEAMDEVGAASAPARRFVSRLRSGQEPALALRTSGLPADTQIFLRSSLAALDGPLHARAAGFLSAHESVIPAGVPAAVERLASGGLPCKRLLAFLARRRDLERETLRLLAERWIARLQDGDSERHLECDLAVTDALRARRRLWDATLGVLGSTSLVA